MIWTPGMSLAAVERITILSAYAHYRENKTATANSLGIAIRTLDSKLAQYKKEDSGAEENAKAKKQKDDDFIRRCRGERAPQPIANGSPKPEGLESAPVIPPQQPLPLSQRETLPGVLSRPASAVGSRRSRG